MPSKQSQRREAAKLRDALEYRSFLVRANTVDEAGRTDDATISTESPVPMPDYARGEMIPEVLLASGMEAPASRQVPLLDSHSRNSMNDQLGSARNIRADGGEIVGTLNFASGSDRQWQMVREGHATDVSAGYQVQKRVFVPRGETQNVGGRSFTGPVNVVTKWRLREVSLTPIGADEQAKLRGLDATAFADSEEFVMNPELRKLLVARGMLETLTDEEAQRWAVDNFPQEKREDKKLEFDENKLAELVARQAAILFEKQEAARKAYWIEADSLCDLADMPDQKEAVRALGDIKAAKEHLTKIKAENSARGVLPSPTIRITGEGKQRFAQDIGTSLVLRACSQVADKQETVDKVFPVAQRGKGADQWKNATLFQVAEECVRMDGVDTRGMTREDVAILAMFGAAGAEARGLDVRYFGASPALHTTGSFSKITQDAINKSMMVGYTEAPSTWEGPMRQGMSVPDFKTIHRIRLGNVPNIPVWPDNGVPEKGSFADTEETYAVESRSLEISFSYKLLVNDDMSALTRVPANMGNAARRTVNAVAWSVITANPTMISDSVALFSTATGNRKRANYTSSGAAPSVTQLQTGTNLMMQMRGENTLESNESDDVLALMPRYIVGPSALRTTINQLVLSAYDPAASSFQRYNTATELIPVIEPLLDANSTTAWYLFASPAQIDTVEVTFLQGQETPQVRNWQDMRTLSQQYAILQTFAAKALNHRGIYKDNGA